MFFPAACGTGRTMPVPLLMLLSTSLLWSVNAHLTLNSDGSMGKNLISKSEWAAKLSKAVYYGEDYDPNLAGTLTSYTNDWWVKGDALVHWQYKTCFVAFQGMDLLGASDGSVDGEIEKAARMAMLVLDDVIQDTIDDIKDSGFTPIPREHTTADQCRFNTGLIQDWLDDHVNGDSGLFDTIETCMDLCAEKHSESSCKVIYTGHSQGGVEAMATAYYLEDKWFHQSKPPAIITFGQPGTFNAASCPALAKWEDYMYRYINLQKFNSDGVSFDIAPTIGGTHMGNTVLLSEDVYTVKFYDHSVDPYMGPYRGDSFSIFTDGDYSSVSAHSMSKYKARLLAKDHGGNSRVETTGFSRASACDIGEHCKSGSCPGNRCS